MDDPVPSPAPLPFRGWPKTWRFSNPSVRRWAYYSFLVSPLFALLIVLIALWPQLRTSVSARAVSPIDVIPLVTQDPLTVSPAKGNAPVLAAVIQRGAALIDQSKSLVQRSVSAIVPPWTGDQQLTFLILGVDRRGQEIPRSDAIIAVSIDPVSLSGVLISVPRDLFVDVSDYGAMRINQAFAHGGSELALETLEVVLDLPINYFINIDFHGFTRIIDTLGGLKLDVQQPLYDPFYPNSDDDGFNPLSIPAGVQRLNGQQALGFVRSRLTDPESDFGRSKRQQQLLLALRDQVRVSDVLARLPSLVQQLSDTVTTDFPLTKVASLAKLVMSIPDERITRIAINYDEGMVVSAVTETGADVLIPDLPQIRKVVHRAISGGTYLPEGQTVPVEAASYD